MSTVTPPPAQPERRAFLRTAGVAAAAALTIGFPWAQLAHNLRGRGIQRRSGPCRRRGRIYIPAITLKDGRVEQDNFNGYRVLRINEMPKVEVHIVPSSEAPTGVGEPGVAPVGPAVANAIFSASGRRVHILPFATPNTV